MRMMLSLLWLREGSNSRFGNKTNLLAPKNHWGETFSVIITNVVQDQNRLWNIFFLKKYFSDIFFRDMFKTNGLSLLANIFISIKRNGQMQKAQLIIIFILRIKSNSSSVRTINLAKCIQYPKFTERLFIIMLQFVFICWWE